MPLPPHEPHRAPPALIAPEPLPPVHDLDVPLVQQHGLWPEVDGVLEKGDPFPEKPLPRKRFSWERLRVGIEGGFRLIWRW